MGCDCNILLPNDVRVKDVANVIGILAGLPKSWQTFDTFDNSDAKWLRVEGAKTECCSDIMPEMCTITLSTEEKMIDGETNHFCYYHFENEDSNYRLVSFRSTPFWIAVGLGVCEFFGGKIDFNDCDKISCDRALKKPRKINNPCDGKNWIDFNKAIDSIEPLTIKDLKNAQKDAGYLTEDIFENSIVTVSKKKTIR